MLAFPLEEEIPVGRYPDEGGRGPGASSDPPEPPLAIGDVVVCPEVAQRQASERGIALDDELALLVVHGTLHLFGYDHAEPDDAERMQRRERELLGVVRRCAEVEPSRERERLDRPRRSSSCCSSARRS